MKTGRLVDGELRALVPARCLLCGVREARGTGLCEACASELPRNEYCCARCALPMESPSLLCGRCIRRAPPWDSAWSPFCYAWPLDRLEARFKFGSDLAAGRVLAEAWCKSIAPMELPHAIAPVPLHHARLRSRGYNQSLELAKHLSKSLRIPLSREILQRTRATAAQSELTAVQRRRNVRGAFVAHFNGDTPQHLAILDDVFTTGATLAECARVLKRAGVERVDVWALARAPVSG
ncbi:MAG: ComF family protein [Rhodanobacteraceae bacterium]